MRRKGLIGKDEFKNARSGGARNIVRKYAGVIEGRETVVSPKTRLIPGRLRKALKERRGKLIVPKVEGTVSTSIKRVGKKGAKKIVITRSRRTANGQLVHETVTTPNLEIPKLPKGKVYRVVATNWGRQSARYFSNEKSLNEFLDFYDNSREWLDISIANLPKSFTDDE